MPALQKTLPVIFPGQKLDANDTCLVLEHAWLLFQCSVLTYRASDVGQVLDWRVENLAVTLQPFESKLQHVRVEPFESKLQHVLQETTHSCHMCRSPVLAGNGGRS